MLSLALTLAGALSLTTTPSVPCVADFGSGWTQTHASPPAWERALAWERAPADDPLRDAYAAGIAWADFLGSVQTNQRRALWDANWEGGQVPDDLLARAQATGGPWRILAITDPACSDSVNTVPYLAHLAEALPSVEIRIVSALIGRPWMEAHRSPDGRASTPTVLLLDEDYTLRGCWVEQPKGMAAFWLDVVARGTMSAEVGRKMEWYAEDAGRSTLEEFVEVMEAAQAGTPICPGMETAR